MSKAFIIRLCCPLLLLASAACTAKTESIEPTAPDANQASANAKSPATTNANIPACTALTSAEIEAVQGEAVRETQGNNQTGGGLLVSHCVYVLPTFNKSLSFDITRADSSSASKESLKKFWEIRFRQPPRKEEEGERAKKPESAEGRGKKGEGEKEKEENAQARPVSGVGEEAFWVGGRIKGTLYVRSRDVVIILSLGGADDDQTKIKKTSLLAQMALKRL